MAEQEQNRGEPASPFKQEEARKQGQVAKSLDFNTAVLTWALLIALVAWGSTAWRGLLSTCAALFVAARHGSEGDGMFAASISMGTTLLHLVVPVAAVAAVFAIVANLVQTGPIFSVVPLKPKWERINPVAGFKRIFNKKMLFDAKDNRGQLQVIYRQIFGSVIINKLDNN